MQIKPCLYALVPLMSSITHLLFVVVWYCKQIWFRQQSGTSEWDGSDYWGRWNLHPFSSPSALCLAGAGNRKHSKMVFRLGLTLVCRPRWMSFFFSACTFMSSRQDYDAVETERLNHWEWQYFLQQSLPRWFFSRLNEVVLCFIPMSHTHFLLGCQR